jgi:hypothetical protein
VTAKAALPNHFFSPSIEGKPADFEALGNRLGFSVIEDSPKRLYLKWRGPRFPAFLCLGIALLLLFVSIPITQAIYWGGFGSRAASLWYFPLMNLVLLGIAGYLLVQQRTIVVEGNRSVRFSKRRLFGALSFYVSVDAIEGVKLGLDQVYSGFAVAGSSAAQSFPVPSLRLCLRDGETVLIDRGSARRLKELGTRIAQRLGVILQQQTELP